MAAAAVCSGGAPASSGAGTLLGGARKLCRRGMTDGELGKEVRKKT